MIANKCEMRVAGLQRSGNHAIINWIIGMCQGKLCFLNKAELLQNPYLSSKERILMGISEKEIEQDKKGHFTKKDFLIYSYEDCLIEEVFSDEFEKSHDKYLGRSAKRIDIVILRDPFNYFASRIKLEEFGILNQKIYLTNEKARKLLMKMWKDYAKEYLDMTSHAKSRKVVISYNEWCSSASYRKSIAKKLGLKFKDEKVKDVARYGPGSSFDKLNYAGKADKMKVLERWETFKDNSFYREIFKDEELVDLSNRIFGRIDGTEALFESQNWLAGKLDAIRLKGILLKGKARLNIKKILKYGKKH